MKSIIKIGFIGLALLFSSQSYAATTADPLIEGAKLCTKHLPRYEREYAIPTHLLSAIASTESGRYHEGLKLKLPWPWTINAGGKGYFYDSKEEAIAAVKKLRAHGVQSIDVGCMQVNLYHHPDAFSSLDKAFEPEYNIAYAAGFLRGLYNENGTWKKAAADYHSKTPKLGSQYVDMVYDSWFNIIEKLREARLHVPASAVVGMNELKNSQGVTTIASAHPAARVRTTPLPEQEGKRVANYTHPHMNNIQVASNENSVDSPVETARQETNILVVKPETSYPVASQAISPTVSPVTPAPVAAPVSPIVTADSSVLQSLAPMSGVPSTPQSETIDPAKLIQVDDRRPLEASVPQNRKSGPNFIFND